MANNPNLPKFTSETARAAGKKSKRGPSIITRLKEYIKNNPSEEIELVEALLRHAKDGNGKFMEMAIQYLDGKVADKHEHSGPDGGPIDQTLKIEFVEKKK